MNIPVFIKANGRRRLNLAKEVSEINRLRLSYERSLGRNMMRAFKKTSKTASENYTYNQDFTIATAQIRQNISSVLLPHYESVIKTFSNRVFDATKNTPFQVLLDQYLIQYGAEKITGISNTTANLIRSAIFSGEAEGLGVSAIAKLIEERTSGAMGRSRAATIARTETHAAASWATHTAIQDQPLRYNKQWTSVGDSRTRAHHAAMNGVEVGPDEDFIVRVNGREYPMAYTHDPRGGAVNNINCRCVTLYVADEDQIFRD